MKNSIILFLSFLSVFSFGQTINNPESVDYDYATSTWYISNRSEILTMDSQGNVGTFTTNISSALGIEVVGNKLYVNDGGIKIFNLNTGQLENTIYISGAIFLNGMTSDRHNNVWVTDFSANKVYHIDVSTNNYTLVGTVGTKPNGIIYDESNDRLLVVEFKSNASIYQIDLANNNAISVAAYTSISTGDGIALDCEGNVYVSAWGTSSLERLDANFQNQTTVASGLNSPADIFYSTTEGQLAVAYNAWNGLYLYNLPCLSTTVEEESAPQIEAYLSDSKINLFNIQGQGQFKLYDIQGKEVLSTMVSTYDQIDVSGLVKGNYIIKIMDESSEVYSKMISIF